MIAVAAILANVGQGFIHDRLLRLALVLFKVGSQLGLGLVDIQEVFLSCAKSQPADITVGNAGRDTNKTDNLQIAFCHVHDCI
jgi:hypothetical protein